MADDETEPTKEEPEGLNVTEMLHRAGITYRQLDFWTSRKYLHLVGREQGQGTGVKRLWAPGEDAVALLMNILGQNAGIKPDVACGFARRLLDGGWIQVLGDTVKLTLDRDRWKSLWPNL